ncbi:unnamed protein product, partial [Rotaria magnacalcarata]
GSQQNSSGNTGGNVITLSNNDMMQQRTSLGNGQQGIIKNVEIKRVSIDLEILKVLGKIKASIYK